MAWGDDVDQLRQAGFSDGEIAQEQQERSQKMIAAGFSGQEVNEYFNPPAPDMKSTQQYIRQNLADAKQDQSQPSDSSSPQPTPHPAQSMLEALEAGFQMSTTGLVSRGKLPDTVLPQDAPMAMRIASQAGTLAGDLPAMVGGGIFGGVAGSEVPGVGNVAGAAYGAWAAPAAIRSAYIQELQKGTVKSFGDFWDRAGSVFIDQLKAGTTGLLTEGAGGLAEGLGSKVLGPAAQTGTKLAAQLATMTTVGKAMDGQMPKAQDFVDGAMLLGGFHLAGAAAEAAAPHVQTKLQEIYAATGIRPEQVVQQADQDPVLKREILSESPAVPDSLKGAVEPKQSNQELIDGHKTVQVDADVPKSMSQKSPVLGDGFAPEDNYKIAKEPEASTPAPAPTQETTPEAEPTAREKILSRIGEPTDEVKTEGWDNWYTKVVDKLNPIAKLRDAITEGQDIPKTQDPYAVYGTALSRGFARADEAVRTQIQPIVEKFKDDPDGFKAYGMAKRALERSGKGFDTGFDLDACKEYVDQNKGKYEEDFQKLVDAQTNGVRALHEAGFFADDQLKQMLEDSKDYFPMRRVVEGNSSGVSSSKPVKAFKGSELQVVDPFEQMIRNQYAYYRLAEENKGKQSIVDLANSYGKMNSDLIEKVPQTQAPIQVSPQELNAYLSKYGIHEGDPDAMTIFRPLATPLADNEFSVMNDGKRQVYSVDPSVAKALKATDYSEPNLVMKAANAFATAQRIGITENPFFLLKHAIRDQFTATIQSQNGYRFAYDGLRGLAHYFSDSEDYNEFLRNGGGMATLADFDKQYIKSDVWGLSKETGLLDKVQNLVKTPFDMMKVLAEATFTAPKMGEYLRAREAGKDSFTAAYEARNVTVDVQRQGSDPFLRAWGSVTPFMNMRIRGLDRMVQAFQEDPSGTAMKMGLALTLPSLATWWAFKDDERYKNTPQWEKDLFWVIPTGDPKSGTTYRVPKPFEPGLLFGSLAERTAAEYYDKNPNAFKNFGEALVGGALPNVVPPAIMPSLEQFGNRSWLTGGNIVPDSLKEVAPPYQYTNYTTDTAKALGKIISYIPGVRDIGPKGAKLDSPMVIENYIRGWTGETGMYALQLADKGLEEAGITPSVPKPASTLADIPYVKAFVVRYPGANAQSIQDFYDAFDKAQERQATINHLTKIGDVKSAYDYMNSPEAQENMVRLSGLQKAISTQNKLIQSIYQNPKMSPNDKRQQIDTTYYQMIQAAEYGNKIMQAMEKK